MPWKDTLETSAMERRLASMCALFLQGCLQVKCQHGITGWWLQPYWKPMCASAGEHFIFFCDSDLYTLLERKVLSIRPASQLIFQQQILQHVAQLQQVFCSLSTTQRHAHTHTHMNAYARMSSLLAPEQPQLKGLVFMLSTPAQLRHSSSYHGR